MRVLVVEDDDALREVFGDILRLLGHDPALARTGEAVLAQLERDRPDAILLDIDLRGINGLDSLRIHASRAPGVPIVVVSGFATEREAQECLRLGAFDFVPKPVTLKRMTEVLKALELFVFASAGRGERRRSSRVSVALPIQVVGPDGREWSATSVDVAAFGLKLDTRLPLPPDSAARISFRLPDEGPQLDFAALLVRDEPDGQAFFFLPPQTEMFRQLNDFLARAVAVAVQKTNDTDCRW